MPSTPHITVAAVMEKDGKYLMVKEVANELIVFNQPAGHWEVDETLTNAAIRETLEETAWEFTPEALVGIYRWKHPHKDDVYLRVTFCGSVDKFHADQILDNGIIEAVWMSRQELVDLSEIERRSAMVLQSIEDYEQGQRYDLTLLSEVIENW